jgi:DNA-binding response OmpR family regulator
MRHGKREVDVYVKRVRDKLAEVSPRWRCLTRTQPVGYRFEAKRVVEPL